MVPFPLTRCTRVGHNTHTQHGFSLIELSIVLVVIGLLTGSILAGRSMIRAGELRAITTEYQNYKTAFRLFRGRYNALPGDMRNATTFWGRLNSNADCVTNSSAAVSTAGACDGDANIVINYATSAGQAAEFAQFWRELRLAGLINGDYSGLAGSGGVWHSVRGVNAPASKFRLGTWSTVYWTPQSGATTLFDGNYDSCLILGGETTTSVSSTGIFTPEDLWNLDNKLDDGMPATGKLVVRARVACAVASDNSALTTSAADAAKLDSLYGLSYSAPGCSLIFRNAF